MKSVLVLLVLCFYFTVSVFGKLPVTPKSTKAQKQRLRYGDMVERNRKTI